MGFFLAILPSCYLVGLGVLVLDLLTSKVDSQMLLTRTLNPAASDLPLAEAAGLRCGSVRSCLLFRGNEGKHRSTHC